MIELFKYSFIINILTFLLFSVFYFNTKEIKIDWKWQLLKFLTLSFWLYSSYRIVYGNLSFSKTEATLFLAFNLISTILFFWSFSHTSKYKFDNIFVKSAPRQIIQSGPYQFVRHPYYSSYIICYSTILLIDLSFENLFFLFLLFALYYLAAKNEESFILKSPHGETYSPYMKQTKRFIPFIF